MSDQEDYPLNIADLKVNQKETELNSPTPFRRNANSVTIVIMALNEEASSASFSSLTAIA